MQLALGIGLIVFFTVMVAISLFASRRIHTGEDFIVAGRGLSGIMTTATIMATWYAAETILVTADTVRTDGLQITVLEPIGIGLCLILAGLVFARRLWQTKLLTLADVVGNRFGPWRRNSRRWCQSVTSAGSPCNCLAWPACLACSSICRWAGEYSC